MKIKPFKNEPINDFSIKSNFNKQKKALQEVRTKLGKTYDLYIGGKQYQTENKFHSYNPSDKDEVLATFSKGTVDLVNLSVETAFDKFQEWKYVPAEKRAKILLKAASIARKRRFEINAWMILEAGKNFTEADADTAEAIDFLEFYARETLRYSAKQPLTPVKKEKNELVYIPLGVGVVIPPWNFPFAILVGMTSAAIVSGNTVVLKPSSETPMIGYIFYEIMKQAGLPDGVLNFLKSKVSIPNELNPNFEKKILLNGEEKSLSFSTSQLDDPEVNQISYTVVIKDMTETKRLEEEAKRNEKLSAMGELASGVAHEIRNPINAIGMIAQRLNKEFTTNSNQNEYSDITQLLRTEVNRINKIITQFLSYAKPIELNPKPVNIKTLFDEVYHLFEDQAKQKGISLIKSYSDSIIINVDHDLIKQSLMNIVQNAIDAVGYDGEVNLKYLKIKNDVIIEISDNGAGIPDEQQKKIFDLYFTTKKEGNGLGLSISQKIVSQHNGSISFTSTLNKGTTFRIILPLQ